MITPNQSKSILKQSSIFFIILPKKSVFWFDMPAFIFYNYYKNFISRLQLAYENELQKKQEYLFEIYKQKFYKVLNKRKLAYKKKMQKLQNCIDEATALKQELQLSSSTKLSSLILSAIISIETTSTKLSLTKILLLSKAAPQILLSKIVPQTTSTEQLLLPKAVSQTSSIPSSISPSI